MSSQLELPEIEYPESDGKPMGETDVHRGWMNRVIDLLKYRYQKQRVYVTGNLLLYYERGNAKRFVSPDVFVVKECDPSERRVFKIWEEGVTPQVVFEVTSLGTRQEDLKSKHQLYQSLGVEEYFLYDPTGEYLKPPLRGYRLNGGVYRPLKGDAAGELACEQLDIRLRVEDGQLVLRDGQTGAELLTRYEAAEAAREVAEGVRLAAEAARQVEHEARLAEQQARTKAEAALKSEASARLATDAARLEAEAARLAAEAARVEEESRRLEEQTTRLAAEARNRELEAELARLREQLRASTNDASG